MSDLDYDVFGYPAVVIHDEPGGYSWYSCPICGPTRRSEGSAGHSNISRHVTRQHADLRRTP